MVVYGSRCRGVVFLWVRSIWENWVLYLYELCMCIFLYIIHLRTRKNAEVPLQSNGASAWHGIPPNSRIRSSY